MSEGWIFCRDNPDECLEHVLAAGPTLGRSHQAWQLNEVNALIWPSPAGIGVNGRLRHIQFPYVVAIETISAFGTVGLSLNYTPLLTDTGRVIVALIMLMGRAGPLTIALAGCEEALGPTGPGDVSVESVAVTATSSSGPRLCALRAAEEVLPLLPGRC